MKIDGYDEIEEINEISETNDSNQLEEIDEINEINDKVDSILRHVNTHSKLKNNFFTDKYRPTTIKDAKFHKQLLLQLQHMSKDESIPHMLFSGPEGCGKKTIIRMLLEMLYDTDVHKTEDSTYTVMGSGGKPTPVTIKQSNYHIVIEPNNNNFDRYLIQDIVKEYAKKMPLGVFRTKKIFKTVLINNIDNLSYYAQTSLRRTMEIYSSTCRFIMWCSCPTRVIEPLISRCIFFTISSPTDDQLFSYILEVSIQEKINLTLEDYVYILDCAQGNIKEALWILQLYKYGYAKKNVYYHTIDLIHRIVVSHNIDHLTINNNDERQTKKIHVRDLLYNIMITNISGTRIMRDLLNKLCENVDVPDECKHGIIEAVSYFEHNIIRGRRHIIHLEALIIKIMEILYEYEKKHPEYKAVFSKYNIDQTVECDKTVVVRGRRFRRILN